MMGARIGELAEDHAVERWCSLAVLRRLIRECREAHGGHESGSQPPSAYAVVQLMTEDALVVVKEFDATAKAIKDDAPARSGRRREPCGRRNT